MPIFVLAIDGGCEGHTPPIQAFADEETARSALAIIKSSGSSCAEIFEVPMWPESPVGKHWDIKPLPERNAA